MQGEFRDRKRLFLRSLEFEMEHIVEKTFKHVLRVSGIVGVSGRNRYFDDWTTRVNRDSWACILKKVEVKMEQWD